MNDHALEQAGETADRVRGELLRTLEELDRRRHEATHVRERLNENRALLLKAGMAVLAALAAQQALSLWARRRAQARLPERRRRALTRSWEHPERLAREERGLARRFGSAVLLGLGAGAARVFAARVMRNWVGETAPRRG